MIHVCSLARLNDTVHITGARHVVTLLKDIVVPLPPGIERQNHLVLRVDDIISPMDGYVAAGTDHIEQLVQFVRRWDRSTPMVFHCFAGISRSTAAAFAAVCALDPVRDELQIAQAIRRASPIAQPNARIVALADRALGRSGRMVRAIQAIGPGSGAFEGNPFRLDLISPLPLPPGGPALHNHTT
jgi:predicted protein tyrosine phosphatase